MALSNPLEASPVNVQEYVGVDGCKGGWVAVSLRDGVLKAGIFANIEAVVRAHPGGLFLVDIPIGLPSRSAPQARQCEKEARKCIAERRSSVFPAPARETLYAVTYDEARDINKRVTGSKISKQAWAIVPKIKEVDEYLASATRSARIREIHPELCFWALNSRTPLHYAKRKPEGITERLRILERVFPGASTFVRSFLPRHPRSIVALDDVLDALAGAITGAAGPENLKALPCEPQTDTKGVAMEMVYADLPGLPLDAQSPF